MKYMIVSLLFHTLGLFPFFGSIAEISQHQFDVSIYTSEQQKSVSDPFKNATRKAQPLLSESSSLASRQPSVAESDSGGTQQDATITLSGQMGSAQSTFGYLISQIYKNRIYPQESIRLKQQGQVTVKFKINEDGKITDIEVASPSSYKLLNQAAIKTLNQISISADMPNVENLFNRSYSFTFDFEITKPLTS